MESTKDSKKQNWFVRHKIISIILGIIVLVIVVSAFTNDNSKQPDTNVKKDSSSEVKETVKSKKPVTKKPSVPAEYTSALNKANSYANTMDMSRDAVYDQLTSEYGEKFSVKAAQYAVKHVKADWNANALAKAKSYQDNMSMSPTAIHDQLTSKSGEQFTVAQADYAIAHLND